ncbi:CBO0543 family protein [Bacillus sinesaloumensis]|uniref:CBO0543 family protein n=1 Tax=Litchfieldia sinesaloumensis TaxID=1926280 RepID=UPI0009888899|nr:CBO0543 family protein [Bacillus sinesaloumensis]
MHLLYNALFLVAAIKWGDWKGWRTYYPTILFFIVGDLIKNILYHDYWVWTYQETLFAQNILLNHTFISFLIMFVSYPATVLIFLGRYPEGKWKQILWTGLWMALYIFVEYINLEYLQLIKHHHGWSMGWSILFNLVMFPMLRLHQKNPLIAWGLSIVWIIFLILMFPIPMDYIK